MRHALSRWSAQCLLVGVTAAAAVAVACAPRGGFDAMGRPEQAGERHGRVAGVDRIARIALATNVARAAVSASTRWRIDEQGGRQALVRGGGGEPWRIERRGVLLRVAGDGDDATPWRMGPFVARPTRADGFVMYNGKRYRGELWFLATDSGVAVVNRVGVEEYLRGVVPAEMGTRQASDRAAFEAQAIAARSYAYVRVPADRGDEAVNGWDMVATVSNQVYAGVDAEHALASQAVDATAGLVLRYGGLPVDAPYSASCGGRSATPQEVWPGSKDQPYLQVVDDLDPATGRPYCDLSPRNHWSVELSEDAVAEAVRRAAGASVPVRTVRLDGSTASGRVAAVVMETERGDVRVPSADVRRVFRDARGVPLASTYFSVEREARGRGRVTGLTLRGHGYGHGVGLCQWGAIGRARAGQDARAILRHYYPGTVVGFVE